MKTLCLVLSILLPGLLVAASCATAVAPAPSGAAELETLARGNTAFAGALYHRLGEKEANTFFSPYGISTAIGMAYAGARANTAREMGAVMHFEQGPTELPPAFKRLNEALDATARATGQKLNLANALVLTGADVGAAYKTILEAYYDAEIFSGGLDVINAWVKQKTETKIEKILDKLDPDSVCVILNAIYFKGAWERAFEKNRTQDTPFHVSAALQVNVPLMHRKSDFRLLDGEDFQAISIPYKGKKMSMTILLPNAKDGLPALEAKLSPQSLPGWLADLDRQPPQKVALYLPKFKLETGYDLVPACKRMGMQDAFEMPSADFSGMGWPQGKLYISQIKHKAFIEVNEEGTEAAAATAVEMATKSAARPPKVFRADHPFVFVIRDNPTGTILFMGRVTDPARK